MFPDFQNFDEAFSESPVSPMASNAQPLRRRKTLKQRLSFYLANLAIMPVVAVVYASLVADGIRMLMPVFQRRLYQLPIPGAGMARQYDGFDRADLAIVVSLLLFVVVSWLWCRVFLELQGFGAGAVQFRQPQFVRVLLAAIAAVIILGDAAIFYVGLASQTSSEWNESPKWVIPAATLIYSCGLAAIGWWHADFSEQQRQYV